MASPSEIEAAARAKFQSDPNNGMSTRDKLRFGAKGSIVVDLTGEYAGWWHSFESGESGRLELNGHWDDWEFNKRHERPKRKFYRPDDDRVGLVEKIKSRCRDPFRSPVEYYLERRGIYCKLPHSIRYCEQPRGMAGLFQNPAGDITAIQITYLTISGEKDSRLVQKKTFATGENWHKNSAIRIPGRGELVLCEGIETALSIHQVTGRPVWACTSTSVLSSVFVKRKQVTVAHDGDKPGSDADKVYQRTVSRLKSEGKRVKLAKPPVGKDFNDVLNEQGEGAVLEMIMGAELVGG